jgi:hypothetical protein
MKKLLRFFGQSISKYCICYAILLVFLNYHESLAQEDYSPKFGVISQAEFADGVTGADSTAEAVMLYDRGDVTFRMDSQKGLVMIFKYWGRIKILKESGLSRASIAIPFRKGTYKFEKMKKSAIVRENVSDKMNLVKINLPNVVKGSVIEYTYTKETPLNTQDHPDKWHFQGGIPIKWSEYRMIVPGFLYYKIVMGGYLNLHIHKEENISYNAGVPGTNSNATSHRFVVKDSPAFLNEPFITSESDYLSSLSFELSTISLPSTGFKSYSNTWENVDKTFMTVNWFGGQLKRWPFIKDAAGVIAAKSADPKIRMWMAFEHTRNTIKWNESAGNGGDIKKAFDNKKGNAAEVNLFLVNLLKELGMEANPVVLSTRNNGMVLEHIPSLEKFNYVVGHVMINEQEVLLDATGANLLPGILPEHTLNSFGRLIPQKGTGRFIDLSPKMKKITFESVEANINPESGELEGKYKLSYGGYQALRWKSNITTEQQNKVAENLESQNPDWEFEDVNVEDKSDSSNIMVTITYNFRTEEQNADRIYFNPMLGGRIKKHELTAPYRIYPLDFTATSNSVYLGKFVIPDNYEIEEMPKSEVVNLPDNGGRFLYGITNQNGLLTINSTISLNRIQYTAEEYTYLRQFFDMIVKKHAQPIVLKKK